MPTFEIDRKIRAYALPSLATLLVEPLLIAADTTMVGHLGTFPLAGLSLASTLLTTVVGLCIFLAYATTASTGTLVGAGRRLEAARNGIEGLWLAAGLGIVLGLILRFGATPILNLFDASHSTLNEAHRYLTTSAFGLPGMLLVLAATGALRGFGDTLHPLYAATAGALLNIPLNYVFIYPMNMGVAGAGLGTAVAQTMIGLYLAIHVARLARASGASLAPSHAGTLRALNEAWPLIVRTVCLRAAILVQIAVATGLGTAPLAANQITMTLWNFAAYGLDSLATAAQILVSNEVGAGGSRVRFVLQRCLRFGTLTGVVLGVALAAASPFLPQLMGAGVDVRPFATVTLIVIAVFLPVASVAYILDGVLIGASDTRRLAAYMCGALAVFAPLAWVVQASASAGLFTGPLAFALLWAAYAGAFMTVRAGTMYIRVGKLYDAGASRTHEQA